MHNPLGVTPHKLDPAGRLKLREEEKAVLGSRVIMACGFDNCINVFTLPAWGAYEAPFRAAPQGDPDMLDLRRLLLSTAEPCDVDAQGRVKIPEFLFKWAGLGDDSLQAYLLQVDEGRWECWEAGHWQEYLDERAQALKQMARNIWGAGATGGGEVPTGT